MESITKRKLETERIIQIVQKAYGDEDTIKGVNELTDGYFNMSYLIQWETGRKAVLKISPKEDVKVLSYERNLMKAEVYVLKQIAKVGKIPVPKIHYYDESRELVDSDYFFMDYIEGVPLNKVREKMNQEDYEKLSEELGEYAKNMIHRHFL